MDRLSQDGWDGVFEYLLPRHLARLWATGDTCVQARILGAHKRRVHFTNAPTTDFCARVLMGRARELNTDFIRILPQRYKPSVLLDTLCDVSNLVNLTFRSTPIYYWSKGPKQAVFDLTALRRLQVCHFVPGLFLPGVLLPKSITEATIPARCAANFDQLTALVTLTLTYAHRGVPLALNDGSSGMPSSWPPSLSSLDLNMEFDEKYIHILPATLTHLGFHSGRSAAQLKRCIPVQCTALESLYFSGAWYGQRQRYYYIEHVHLPPMLRSLEIGKLELYHQTDFDNFLDFIPTTVTNFKVGVIRVTDDDAPASAVNLTPEQRLAIMARVTLECVESHIFRFCREFEDDEENCDDYDVDHERRLRFVNEAKKILARHGLTHDSYAAELVTVDRDSVAFALDRLPPSYSARLLKLVKAWYGSRIKQCKFVDGVSPREHYDAAQILFARGIATRLVLKKREGVPAVVMAPLFSTCIANRLKRIRIGVVNRWFTDFFAGDLHYPRLKRIAIDGISHKVAIAAIYSAKRRMPLLERVALEDNGVLDDVALIKMMAEMRLYGYTAKRMTVAETEMTYCVAPPWFYYEQLKGNFDIKPMAHVQREYVSLANP